MGLSLSTFQKFEELFLMGNKEVSVGCETAKTGGGGGEKEDGDWFTGCATVHLRTESAPFHHWSVH